MDPLWSRAFSAVTRRQERRSDLTPCASCPYAALASEHHGGLMHNRLPCDGRGGEHHKRVRRPAPVASCSSIGPLAISFLWPCDVARHCSTQVAQPSSYVGLQCFLAFISMKVGLNDADIYMKLD